MSESTSRFTPQNKTTHERLSTNTVGLVALSDFRKRRAEVLEQQEREARELATAAATPPDRSLTSTPNNAASDSNSKDEHARKKKKRPAKALVSFGGDEEEEDDDGEGAGKQPALSIKSSKFKINSNKRKEGDQETPEGATAAAAAADKAQSEEPTSADDSSKPKRITANPSALIVPRALTKSALRKEAEEKEALRKEFLTIQAAVKATEIAIPFVFYDGTNTPGGIVRVKKGDHVWLFLDKSRKVGAQLRVGSEKSFNYRRNWARVSVDDLILVRGSIIIPHHYEFYYFIMNQTVGPENKLLFDYSADAPRNDTDITTQTPTPDGPSTKPNAGLSQPKSAENSGGGVRVLSDITSLEGCSDDPAFTKVVDRRWYQRNKHIYPANTWQQFDPEKDYQGEIKRDPGGNAFFFSK